MIHRQSINDCYNAEVAEVEDEYTNGEISAEQRRIYLENLYNNLQCDLAESQQ